MSIFDISEVRNFTADLKRRMDSCDSGEGMECANLDGSLRQYAILCCEFRERVRQWGRAVFSCQVAFDPKVEEIFLAEGLEIYDRAMELAANGRQAEVPCYILDNQTGLESALWHLLQLLANWVTPAPSVGPGPRQGLRVGDFDLEQIRSRIRSLPPLPVDWQPSDLRQRSKLKKFLRLQKS